MEFKDLLNDENIEMDRTERNQCPNILPEAIDSSLKELVSDKKQVEESLENFLDFINDDDFNNDTSNIHGQILTVPPDHIEKESDADIIDHSHTTESHCDIKDTQVQQENFDSHSELSHSSINDLQDPATENSKTKIVEADISCLEVFEFEEFY